MGLNAAVIPVRMRPYLSSQNQSNQNRCAVNQNKKNES
uniref:Uncharacterized protein n=1 Tax=Arundo donax TaxID=35708 RepID=A0A0A9CEG8_ARUDO